MNIAMSMINYESKKHPNIAENIKHIEGLGINNVDIAAFENWQGLYPSKLLAQEYYNEWLDYFKNSSLKVDSINAGFAYQITTKNKDEFDLITKHFIKLCEFAKDVNAYNITLGAGRIESRDEVEDNMKLLLERMPDWGNIASKFGVSISLECHESSTLENPFEIKRAMEALFPSIGLTFDSSHLEMQSISLNDAKPLMKYVYYSHIRYASKDNMQQTKENNTLDIKKCIEMLEDSNYEGGISIEYFNDFDDGRQAIPTLKELKKLGLSL